VQTLIVSIFLIVGPSLSRGVGIEVVSVRVRRYLFRKAKISPLKASKSPSRPRTVSGRELVYSPPQPGSPQIPPAASAAIARAAEAPVQPLPDSSSVGDASANSGSSAKEFIVSGNLFDPSRSSAGAAAGPTGPRPLLYGVVAGEGVTSRAYVEDPMTKVVRGYQIGDTVAGWRLAQIREDRVVIAGAEREMLEVLLREPSKPRPALFASAVAAVTAEAQTVGPGTAEAQRIEPGSPVVRQASTPDGTRDAVPQGLGPISSQLFRPAKAQPKTPEAMPGRGIRRARDHGAPPRSTAGDVF
jgi:hypothetical protein